MAPGSVWATGFGANELLIVTPISTLVIDYAALKPPQIAGSSVLIRTRYGASASSLPLELFPSEALTFLQQRTAQHVCSSARPWRCGNSLPANTFATRLRGTTGPAMPVASTTLPTPSAPTVFWRSAGFEPLRGRSQIVAFLGGVTGNVADSTDVKPIVRHNVANLLFHEVTHDRALVSCYFTVVTHIGLDHVGRYRDTLVPDGDTWRIAHRKVSTDWSARDSVMARPRARNRVGRGRGAGPARSRARDTSRGGPRQS